MDRLIVKNFGPLKNVDIELNKINLFIGENGSGKSVLGKIITIILDLENHMINEENLFKKFREYYIDFLKNETIIQFFIDESLSFEIKEKQITNSPSFKEYHPIIQAEIKKTQEKIISENKLTTQYIPAERNLISIFNKYVTTFITADIPLPKFLLNFSSQYVRAREEIRELNLLNIKYQFESDQEHIYYNDKDYLLLERSSSGIQSALPLYLTVKYFAKKHKGIIIEEPEQNLFPKVQTETIKYIIEQVSDENNLFMMTHSPYVLSTLNNLIYAHIVAQLGEKEREEVKEFIAEEQWINPDDFSAYYLENGRARSIVSDIGLISDNEIDDISEEMGGEFDELLEIYRASKND
jgi:predicted ATPase